VYQNIQSRRHERVDDFFNDACLFQDWIADYKKFPQTMLYGQFGCPLA
jgi:hypothetical protein